MLKGYTLDNVKTGPERFMALVVPSSLPEMEAEEEGGEGAAACSGWVGGGCCCKHRGG